MESIASISNHKRLSGGSIVQPPNENIDRSTSQAWTGKFRNRILPISRCHVTAPLWLQLWAWQWSLDWRWLTYLWNIILQGYFQMYPVSPSTSSFSGTPRFRTSAPHLLWGPSKLQEDEYWQLVMRYTTSTSCRSDDCASHLSIWPDSLDQCFGWSASLAAVSYNW